MGTQTNKELFIDGFLKILKEQQVDVRLKACDSDKEAAISAHKLILSARSEVFKKMFEPDKFKDSSKLETITLSEMKQEELEAFVEFIYSDGSILSEKAKQHVRSLYCAADKYEIPHLRDLCRNELIESLNSSNALALFELAQIPFDTALTLAALITIRANKIAITNSAEFKVFVVNHPNLTVQIVKTILTKCDICALRPRTCNCC
ncbi:putative BTB/POZ domain-containing protein [Cardamine amara subsp. amara]|uniref:BTB/POZ domain-containing protein n=1 Tax=Cardamine amara subsp. amara TaxID=228776 RepID=A0ABD0ZWN9_CARAN